MMWIGHEDKSEGIKEGAIDYNECTMYFISASVS